MKTVPSPNSRISQYSLQKNKMVLKNLHVLLLCFSVMFSVSQFRFQNSIYQTRYSAFLPLTFRCQAVSIITQQFDKLSVMNYTTSWSKSYNMKKYQCEKLSCHRKCQEITVINTTRCEQVIVLKELISFWDLNTISQTNSLPYMKQRKTNQI